MKKKIYLLAFFLLITLFFSINSVYADNSFKINANLWNLYQNQGQINFIEGQKIIMSSSDGIQTHPFATSNISSLIQSDFELSFIISFPKITPWGVGLRLGNLLAQNNIPINDFGNYINQDDNFSKLINLQLWQDTTNKFHIWYCPNELNVNCVLNPSANSLTNQDNNVYNKITNDKLKFKLKKINQNLKVYIKNITKSAPEELLFESSTNRLPQFLLLGNNVQFQTPIDYTNIVLEAPNDTLTTPKLIILPGFFGSWNKEAMLHNQQTDPLDWKLNPIATEYDGIINSLKNIGLVENNDFYVFAYDWRKPLNDSAITLNSFITQNIPDQNTKVDLLGHSEGGQVARVYAQQFGTDKVNKLLTVGSPFKGSAIAYKGVEGGEIDSSSPLEYLGRKVILQINKKNQLDSDRKTLNDILPITKDLLPTYDYVTNASDQPISVTSMSIKNDTLLSYQPTLPTIFPHLITFYGEKGDTLLGHKVGPRTIFDELYDLYPDGHPIENHYEIGDETIITTSAKAGDDTNVLVEKNHGEIVTDSIAIKQMFTKLGIPYQNDQIVEGHQTAIFPSLIFLIQSPAVMQVTYDGKTIDEKDGIIFIPNAPSTTYTLKVKGTGIGNYTVNVGEFANDEAIWNKIEGRVINPQNQTDTYTVTVDTQNPQPFIVNQNDPLSIFDALIRKLIDSNKNAPNKSIKASITSLQNARKYFIAKNKIKLLIELQNAHAFLFQSLKETDISTKNKLLEAIDNFENLYDVALKPFMSNVPAAPFSIAISEVRKLVNKNYERLLVLKKKGRDINIPLMYLSAIEQKIKAINGAIVINNSRLATILFQSVGQLLIFVNNFK